MSATFLRWTFAWWGLLACAVALSAETVDDLLQRARASEKRLEPSAALALYREADALRPNNAFILQRIARQLSDSTADAASAADSRRLAEQALAYSKLAYELEPRNPVYVLSMAICYGKLGLYGDNQTRVEHARLTKKFAEEALALQPDYDWAHHVLGRWHYEVADLGGPRRFFAKMLYGGLPPASYEEAIRHLRQAIALSPQTAAHHIELGFALRAAGGHEAEAREEMERGLALPTQEIQDEHAKRRAQTALEKH